MTEIEIIFKNFLKKYKIKYNNFHNFHNIMDIHDPCYVTTFIISRENYIIGTLAERQGQKITKNQKILKFNYHKELRDLNILEILE
jgi:hypothetical protein